MVKTFFNGMSRMLVAVVAVAALVAFCGTTAQAQVSAKTNSSPDPTLTVNPKAGEVGKLGIVAYNLATFKKVPQGTAALTTEVTNLKPTMKNASALNKFKYAYFSQILTDLSYDIAPEISVITSLQVANTNGKADIAEMASLYEYAVGLLK